MLIGYARISKADGSQSLDLQRDALREVGVSDDALYQDQASGEREDRPGLAAFLKAARQGDVIVVWRLDRLGRNLRHLVNLVQDLNDRDIGIRVLAGQGASIDTTTPSGKLVFALFAALAEFERELIRERTSRWIGLCTQTRQRHPSSPSTAYPLRGSRTGSWGWFDLGPAILNPFLVTDTSDFVGSVRCTAPEGGLFTGVAVELDAGNRIFTTLPVVPVEERTDRE